MINNSVNKKLLQAFQKAENNGEFSVKEMQNTYRFALQQLSTLNGNEEKYFRKETSGLENPLHIFTDCKIEEVFVVVHNKKSTIIADGSSKKIFKAVGFYPGFPGRGILMLYSGTLKATQKKSTKSEKFITKQLSNLEFEINTAKKFRGKRGIYEVYGSTLRYPVKGKKGKEKIAIVMGRGEMDLFEALKQKLIREEDLPRLMKDVLLGLNELHKEGYVHRDIKTENIILCKNSSGNELKICDFGSIAQKSKPIKGSEIVTLNLAPPEVIEAARYAYELKLVAKYFNVSLDNSNLEISDEILKKKEAPDDIKAEVIEIKKAILKLLNREKSPDDVYRMGVVLFEMYYGRLPSFLIVTSLKECRVKTDTDVLCSKHYLDLKSWQKEFKPSETKPGGNEKLGELIRSMCHFNPEQRPSMIEVLKSFNEIYPDVT